MGPQEHKKQFDLEERTFRFAAAVRKFVRGLPRTISNQEDIKQLVRSSGSVGANFIEANESFSRRDFLLRVKIVRKEAKESIYWLRLLNIGSDAALETERALLIDECDQLMRIMGTIIREKEQVG